MCREGPGSAGPQLGRAQGSRSAAERLPRNPAGQPRGWLPSAPALGPYTLKVRQLESAPSFCKARDWLEPSEEEVAAASDKRCFLFPAWESISDKRGEKIMPLALRVQGESHTAAEAVRSCPASSSQGVTVFPNLTVQYCPAPAAPKAPRPLTTQPACRMPAPPESSCPVSSSTLCSPPTESVHSPLCWTKGLPVAAFLLRFQLGCPSHGADSTQAFENDMNLPPGHRCRI